MTTYASGRVRVQGASRAMYTAGIFAAGVLAMGLGVTGCASKNYVKAQTGPLVQQTNELDAKTASDHRAIGDTDERAQKGIAGAQASADAANQHANAAGEAANAAGQNAQDAYNRVDTLSGVVANLDNYKPVSDVSVTFAFDKSVLTASDKKQLDDFAASLSSTKGYLLEVTGGTDSTGDAQYNYQLSQRRADAVVNYLATQYNVPPHKFYLIGIGKDQQVASDKTATGRAKNRRVEVKLMSNMGPQSQGPATTNSSGGQ
ncbi:outer membrane protein OmpA-like peptidoglycan-associated protein [Granulicella aggregans]|uniref:Outer membrane protein OmpA-like peptidoglycan-associated protein n=1 Tax=Granulicella aggregans TaxID=474949 RepID=A0A7W8E2W7_9BACT|nr:outer membrane protein OmpA-like peptidoglycan-associated protein [Granulicella aggregans]